MDLKGFENFFVGIPIEEIGHKKKKKRNVVGHLVRIQSKMDRPDPSQ